jgi:hypothetical protein
LGRLTLPPDPTQLLALLKEGGPEEIQNPHLDSPLEGARYVGVIGELLGEAVPPAAVANPKDDRVQGSSLVDVGATSGLLRWIVLFWEGLDPLPQLALGARQIVGIMGFSSGPPRSGTFTSFVSKSSPLIPEGEGF